MIDLERNTRLKHINLFFLMDAPRGGAPPPWLLGLIKFDARYYWPFGQESVESLKRGRIPTERPLRVKKVPQ